MTLGFDDVLHAPLGKLKDAVTDWSQMATKLEELGKLARDGMKAKADKADWAGVNASVTQPFIGKTAKEFDDAVQAAKGVHRILEQSHTTFEKAKANLKRVVDEEAPSRQVTVGADGSVRASSPLSESVGRAGRNDPDYKDLLRKEQSNVTYIANRIRIALEEANEADQDIARTLRANLGDDPHNFSAPKYASTDAMNADRAVTLARKGDKMTDQELKDLQKLLHEHRASPEFTTAFYEGLGAKPSLAFFADLTMKTEGDSKVRTDSLKALQQDLGFSLATATDPDNPTHLSEKWQTDLRKAGAGTIDVYPSRNASYNPYGYQVLGNILRYGSYDHRFLTPVAEHAAQMQARNPGIWKHMPQNQPYIGINLNPAGTDGSSGFNAMTGILEALGHSPEASKDFFDGKMTPYSSDGQKMDRAYFDREYKGGFSYSQLVEFNLRETGDGIVLEGLTGPKGKTVYPDYFEMLTDKNQWFDDRSATHPEIGDGDAQEAWKKAAEKATAAGPDALGHALESAVSGRAYDDVRTDVKPLPHSEEQANLMHRVVEKFGGEGNDLISVTGEDDKKKSGVFMPMRDSLGNMTAEYMRDFQKAMGPDGIETFGADAGLRDLGGSELPKFLGSVARDPDAYGAIINAQQATTADLLGDVAKKYGEGGPQHNLGDARHEVTTYAAPGGEIAGIASQARVDAVYRDETAGDSEFNQGLQDGTKWIERGFGLAIKPLEASVVGAPVAWVIEDVKESVTKHYERDSAADATSDANDVLQRQRQATAEAAREAAVLGAKEAGLSEDEQKKFGDTAADRVRLGYGDGRDTQSGYQPPPQKNGGKS
ncbi:hypothetical protein [Streptomyces sp. NBC_01294]|uniref:hypothetical protein n=1 Tax=Streptomyces sp. NBC_01294 TaxID=2903815 RepID=UPI002DD8E33C|nr:hypothetical protein [Streptomyces sp. NBC_01294]WRZ57362.1 hypothetical protein OG534_13235 [Streptomyces sp. NBC_01294]